MSIEELTANCKDLKREAEDIYAQNKGYRDYNHYESTKDQNFSDFGTYVKPKKDSSIIVKFAPLSTDFKYLYKRPRAYMSVH